MQKKKKEQEKPSEGRQNHHNETLYDFHKTLEVMIQCHSPLSQPC